MFRCFMKDFDVLPVAPFTTGNSFVIMWRPRCVSVVRSFGLTPSSSAVTRISVKS